MYEEADGVGRGIVTHGGAGKLVIDTQVIKGGVLIGRNRLETQ